MLTMQPLVNYLKYNSSRYQRGLFIALTLLFIVSPLYSQPNGGGTGLTLIFNISAWIIASWIIGTGLFLFSKNKQLTTPCFWPLILAFPAFVILSSILATINLPTDWLFRQLYILGGTAFLFALLQFQLKNTAIDKILLIIFIAAGVQAILGTLQINIPNLLYPPLPFNPDFVPRGSFQQVNVLASFLSTGLIIFLYLISRPFFRSINLPFKISLTVLAIIVTYVIAASGSRIGLLSLFLSSLIILIGRRRQLRPHKKHLFILLFLSIGSFYAGSAGLERTLDKTAKLTEQTYSSARKNMFTIGFELISKEPIHGYGIGGFLSAWNKQASNFIERHPQAAFPSVITHPHNEILFWMIEGGALALLGILLFTLGIGIALFKCGFERGSGYLAALLPISLHTQVELPFYLSATHWFLWLFLIYLTLRHQTKIVKPPLTNSANRLIKAVAIIIPIGVTSFMLNTAVAQNDLFRFMYDKNEKPPYLQIALKNIYFQREAEVAAMRSSLHEGIEKKDGKKVKTFEIWAKNYIQIKPDLEIYVYMIHASKFLRPESKGCDAITEGFHMYAHEKIFQEAMKGCNDWLGSTPSLTGEG